MKDVNVGKSKIVVGFKGFRTDTDESLMDMAYTNKAYNFSFDDGVLTGGIGIDEAAGFSLESTTSRHAYPPLPDGKKLLDVFLYRRKTKDGEYDDRLVAQLNNYSFMYTSLYNEDEWHVIPNLYMDEDVTAVNYTYNGEDVLLLATKRSELLMIKNDIALVCGNAPKFSSIAVHNERVFGSINGVQNQVWFSDDFDPQNWSVSADEAGFITFADECGEVIKLVSFLNYLYIFREFGIFRLTAYGDQSEFMLKKVFTDTGGIYKDSIEVCGDKIIFYASDGLYAFDGYEVSKIAKQLPKVFNPHITRCAYLDDCYYMACNIWEKLFKKNNALIRYRLSDNSISVLYGYAIKRLRTVRVTGGMQVLCVMDGANKLGEMTDSGCVMGEPTEKHYFSPKSTLSSPSLKIVRSVTLQTDCDITLRAIMDNKTYEYAINGSKLLRTVPIEHSGRKIGFELVSNSANAYITPMIVAIDTLRI